MQQCIPCSWACITSCCSPRLFPKNIEVQRLFIHKPSHSGKQPVQKPARAGRTCIHAGAQAGILTRGQCDRRICRTQTLAVHPQPASMRAARHKIVAQRQLATAPPTHFQPLRPVQQGQRAVVVRHTVVHVQLQRLCQQPSGRMRLRPSGCDRRIQGC